MREARQRLLQFFSGRQIESRDHQAIIASFLVRR
jgi:hypothetical protein